MFSQKVMSLLNKFVPAGLAMKGLEKVDPRLKSFIGTAVGFGYGANEIIDFLRSKAQTASQKETRRDLEERAARGAIRPDEAANLARLEQDEMPGDVLQALGSAGAAALGGMGASALSAGSRAASPALNQLAGKAQFAASGPIAKSIQPKTPSRSLMGRVAPDSIQEQENLAIPLAEKVGRSAKGIGGPMAQMQGAATPVLAGRAIQGAKGAKATLEARKGQPQNAWDMFARENPVLANHLQRRIDEGISPPDAARGMKSIKKFQDPIESLERRIGAPFENIVGQVLGIGEQPKDEVQPLTPEVTELLDIIGRYKPRGAR